MERRTEGGRREKREKEREGEDERKTKRALV
jgi:hypothetical protein